MHTIKLYFAASLVALFSINSVAQVDADEPDRIGCSTAEVNNARLAQYPFLQTIIDDQLILAKKYQKNTANNKAGAISYTIPLVYHIIHDNGPENVTKAVIDASVANLNEDFQKLNTDLSQVISSFSGITADIEIQFRLAHKDPNGVCTEGITRTESLETYEMDNEAKVLVNWNTSKYLNIWVGSVMQSGSGGYSYLPGFAPTQNDEGIVIRATQLTNSMTHEVGHFLGLLHTWGPSNNPAIAANCLVDDGIGDTPNTIGNQSCNLGANNCSSLDNVQNYMDYAGCTRMFTQGQKAVMHAALNGSAGGRNQLWASANLIATGTNDPYGVVTCAPIAEFSYSKEYICEQASVSFSDQSYNGVPSGWNWTFTGGSPASSSAPAPSIAYNTAGVYSVTYQPSNGFGSGSVTKTNIITVSSLAADYSTPIIDWFENTAKFLNDWRIVDEGGGQTWESSGLAAATGARSVKISNYLTTTAGLVDDLISPSYDLSTSSSKIMKFKYAFAGKSSSNNDKLFVYYSLDCGGTWAMKLPLSFINLTTTTNQGGVFIPSASEWSEKQLDLSSVGSATNIRFKFEFTSGGGNSIYLDDINVGGNPIGIDEFSKLASFKVFPNPAKSSAKISFGLLQDVENLSIVVKNAMGQDVTQVINGQAFSAGQYTLQLDEKRKLAAGIYFIAFSADGQVQMQKLIIQ